MIQDLREIVIRTFECWRKSGESSSLKLYLKKQVKGKQWKEFIKLVLCLNLVSRLKKVQNNGPYCCSCLFLLDQLAKISHYFTLIFSKIPESKV